ncbi:MAG: rhomboid family intramembrane serine protease [Planctomycetes bacterium]|nr:rhomboid family intramembrane serine protease [Planctomycetota bacterium]
MIDETEILRAPDAALLRELSLVLRSVGIPHRVVGNQHQGWIVVPSDRAREALEELSNYHRENLGKRRREAPLKLYAGGLTHALLWCTLLAVMHLLTRARIFGVDWPERGLVDGARVAAGEVWRAATALTLHADLEHLVGNLALGGLFVALLVQVLGPTLTWSTLLATGTLANLLNVAVSGADHRSLGASTAVFAALGMLTAVQFSRKLVSARARMARYVPLIAGVIVFGWYGLGGAHLDETLKVQPVKDNTDVGAHLAGFLVGLAGGALAWRARARLTPRAERWLGAAAVAAFLGAWAAAGLTA